MRTVSQSTASKDLESLVEEVWKSREPVVIELENGHSAVVISKDSFEGAFATDMDETEYLLSNPENARILLKSIDDIKRGRNLQERHLIEE